MNLDVIGSGPSKGTKRTSASVHVFVSDVSLELLNSFEDTETEHADRLLRVVATAHCVMYQVISVRLNDDSKSLDGACLVRRKI